MGGKHKVPSVGVRLDQEFYDWLTNHAKDNQEAINAVVKRALQQYRYGIKQQQGKKNNV